MERSKIYNNIGLGRSKIYNNIVLGRSKIYNNIILGRSKPTYYQQPVEQSPCVKNAPDVWKRPWCVP